jgi:hypothetical protein
LPGHVEALGLLFWAKIEDEENRTAEGGGCHMVLSAPRSWPIGKK